MRRRIPLLLALIVPACGGPDGHRFPVHPAAGRVTHDGAPVAGAFVRFHPADPAALTPPEGEQGPAVMLTTETDADGRFAMSTYVADDGVPPGDYAVTVTPPPAGGGVEDSDGPNLMAPPAAGPPAVYRDPATTPLRATVGPGSNDFLFELE